MIRIPVTYRFPDRDIVEDALFDAPAIPAIPARGSNEATLRAAIASAPAGYRSTLVDLYRELVLANFAAYEGKKGSTAEPELSVAYPSAGTLPGFTRKSGRFNAAGMILYNAQTHLHTARGFELLGPLLAALIKGGLTQPRCTLNPGSTDTFSLPEEVGNETYVEGTVREILVNAFERSPAARQACLAYHGYDCVCCGFNFERAYGVAGRHFIHVHHLVPLEAIRREYAVDPVRDMVPVCPNCHAMIHRPDPPYRINEVALLLQATNDN